MHTATPDHTAAIYRPDLMYDATYLPEDSIPAWVPFMVGSPFVTYAIEPAGVLHVVGNSSLLTDLRQSTAPFGSGTRRYMMLVAKHNARGASPNIRLYEVGGGRGTALTVYPTRVGITTSSSSSSIYYDMDTTDAYHRYTVVINTTSGVTELYVDNVLRLTSNVFSNASTFRLITFTSAIDISVDYIAFGTTEAKHSIAPSHTGSPTHLS